MTDMHLSPLRELALRKNREAIIALYWNEITDEVILRVDGPEPLGTIFEVTVPPEKALDAFDWPFLYHPAYVGARS